MRGIVYYSILLFCSVGLCQCTNPLSIEEQQYWQNLQESIQKNNESCFMQCEDLVAQIEEEIKTKTSFQPLADLAKKLLDESKMRQELLQAIKEDLLAQTGGVYTEEELESPADSLLISLPKNNQGAKVLQAWLDNSENNTKKDLLASYANFQQKLLDAVAHLWQEIDRGIFEDSKYQEKIRKELTAKIAIPNIDNKWFQEHLAGQSIPEALALLESLEAKPIQALRQVFHFCEEQTQDYEFDYNNIELVVFPNRYNWRKGEPLRANIWLLNYANNTNTVICTVDGDTLAQHNGKFLYQTKPTSLGTKEYLAKFELYNPLNGETEHFSRLFRYQVLPTKNR